ncbi:MAG: hypothetical protein QXI36_01215, partial [Candidatus Bathyarchaeia archaeon]
MADKTPQNLNRHAKSNHIFDYRFKIYVLNLSQSISMLKILSHFRKLNISAYTNQIKGSPQK